jgi:hypothetical protein
VFFYLADGPDEPLGEAEYWLVAAPRLGETVTVLYFSPGQPPMKRHLTGEVVDVQWTVEPNDGNDAAPDWCTVDVWLRPLNLSG